MKPFEVGDVALPPSPPAGPVRLVSLRDGRPPTTRPYDDLREITVAVWARTKLIECHLDGRGPVDPNLRASLADIEAAGAAIGARLARGIGRRLTGPARAAAPNRLPPPPRGRPDAEPIVATPSRSLPSATRGRTTAGESRGHP